VRSTTEFIIIGKQMHIQLQTANQHPISRYIHIRYVMIIVIMPIIQIAIRDKTMRKVF